MIDSPTIVETVAQPAAVVHLRIPKSEIQAAIPPAIHEVMGAISAQGAFPAGPMFSFYHEITEDEFDLDVGFPVAPGVEVAPSGRVKGGELPAATVVRTTYSGGYEGLGDAWMEFHGRVTGEMQAELEGRGLALASTGWERYLVGPESGPDPSSWKTELNMRLENA